MWSTFISRNISFFLNIRSYKNSRNVLLYFQWSLENWWSNAANWIGPENKIFQQKGKKTEMYQTSFPISIYNEYKIFLYKTQNWYLISGGKTYLFSTYHVWSAAKCGVWMFDFCNFVNVMICEILQGEVSRAKTATFPWFCISNVFKLNFSSRVLAAQLRLASQSTLFRSGSYYYKWKYRYNHIQCTFIDLRFTISISHVGIYISKFFHFWPANFQRS